MGCFSYICPFCGKGVRSTSFDGELCEIFFLLDGKVIEKMTGRYDSYGRVFKKGGTHELLVKPIEEPDPQDQRDDSIAWQYATWSTLVGLSFDRNKPLTGFAIVHQKCKDAEQYIPLEPSEGDPNQGG